MTIKFRLAQQPEVEIDPTHWSFQIFGPDSIDGSVRFAIVDDTGITSPQDWIDTNGVLAQAMIDAGTGGTAFTIKEEAQIFLEDNPAAESLIDLGPIPLEAAIDVRTAGQETLLLKTYAHAVRFLYARIKEL